MTEKSAKSVTKTIERELRKEIDNIVSYEILEGLVPRIEEKVIKVIESPEFMKVLKKRVLDYYTSKENIVYVLENSDVDEKITDMIEKYIKNNLIFKIDGKE